MSYILEALKKAQAERQLGATPDVHAPTIDAYAARQAGRPAWLPAALGGAVAVVALGLALWWRQDAPAVLAPPPAVPLPVAQAQPLQPSAAPAANQAPAATAQAEQAQAVQAQAVPAPAAQPSAAVQPAPPRPAPATAAPAPAGTVAAHQGALQPAVAAAAARGHPPPSVTQPESRSAANGAPARPVAAPPAQQQAVAAAHPAAPPEPQDEYIPAARDLPEPIQRILPTVAMSGYMYSKNPADRLVLIDKALRREGDEVAPGLVLERLQPKGAVFTFRGYRYRVPY